MSGEVRPIAWRVRVSVGGNIALMLVAPKGEAELERMFDPGEASDIAVAIHQALEALRLGHEWECVV